MRSHPAGDINPVCIVEAKDAVVSPALIVHFQTVQSERKDTDTNKTEHTAR